MRCVRLREGPWRRRPGVEPRGMSEATVGEESRESRLATTSARMQGVRWQVCGTGRGK